MPTASLAHVLSAATLALAATPAPAPSPQPQIVTSDVTRFYQVYDSAAGHPTADQLQRDYLDAGSDGLHMFAKLRNITGERIAAELAKDPALYANARKCVAVLPRARERLVAAMGRLAELYPSAKFPPVIVAISRGKPVGVGSPVTGVMIGLEALCGVTYFDPDMEDRVVRVLLHEYMHVQQSASLTEDDHPTVLESSLIEGAAEFMTSLITGGVAEPGVWTEAEGRKTEIETEFVADEDKKDLTNWLYNGSMTKAGDLGYWVGYRIVKSYYDHASNKRRAIHDILGMTDPKAFLARSGWHPGVVLDGR